jgi:hypothetical protein
VTSNQELWDSVENVLDTAEELESIIGRMPPGADSKPIRKILSGLTQAVSKAQTNLRRLQADPEMTPEELAPCEEALEALDGLLVRLERTQQRLDSQLARNKKRLLKRTIASAIISALATYLVFSWILAAHPGLHLLVSMLIGLGIGVFIGVLFVWLSSWWDGPVK